VVDVLALDGSAGGAGLVSLDTCGGVLELSTLLCQAALVVLGVIMLERAVLNWDNVVVMSLGKDLLIGDGLNGSVVVWRESATIQIHTLFQLLTVLVHLTVHSGGHILMLLLGDGLVLHRWGDSLVDGGVMVTRLGHEALNCLLGLLHCDCVCLLLRW
jgi:hypothetical protein